MATSLNKLAALYVRQGKYTQAVSLYNRSLAIYGKALGADSAPATALSALNGEPVRELEVLLLARK